MASVSGSYSALTSTQATSAGSASKEIAGNFQDFLLLLTTQLKNQSPLDPLDTNQFTQQLVQFAGVEQQLKSNDTLGSILTAMQATSTSSAAGYVGMKITADGSTAALANGAASWTVTPAKDTKSATVTISDQNGAAVATKTLALKAGAQTFTWDGRDASGSALPDGIYAITVRAVDASGQSVAVSTELSGVVSAVNVSSGSPVLTVGTSTIPLSKVRTIAYQ
ncbi:flagellar hook assembly protein FlgD [Enterovirga aerilata]|uniref:Basal-body rod modification protein FlgD n=1 Tax=Enterovirga aerilata TaxID=2730920 RepID=A0A849IC24_9HYPH|nr:flagellar hook capping FlgD N-terminal domain-containing protein [Enterovirga sp. DB1703]NNM73527.1 flagellar hook assembly protein FlgD [Enterovirga sp. DB1703]